MLRKVRDSYQSPVGEMLSYIRIERKDTPFDSFINKTAEKLQKEHEKKQKAEESIREQERDLAELLSLKLDRERRLPEQLLLFGHTAMQRLEKAITALHERRRWDGEDMQQPLNDVFQETAEAMGQGCSLAGAEERLGLYDGAAVHDHNKEALDSVRKASHVTDIRRQRDREAAEQAPLAEAQ